MLDLKLSEAEMEPKDLARIGNLIHSAARTGLITQVRVDEQRLRRKTNDIIPKLLERLEQEKRFMAAQVVELE